MGKIMAITEYEDKIKEIIDKDDHDSFIADFLSVYEKIPRATITKLRKGIGRINLSKEPGEVYLKNKLYYKATDQPLMQTYADLEKKVAELGSKPRYIFVTDFKEVLAKDTKTGDSLSIKFKDLPQYFDFFLAWNGIEKADFEKENPADLKAAERFAKLFDEISKDNEDADRHGLNLFLIRLLFCLFAEDTNIFQPEQFTNYLKQMTAEDGSDMNERISELFAFLDKKDRSEKEPAYLKDFPYVNGQLFTDPHMNLNFSKKTRQLMIDAGELVGWANVNPDILGSMLQAVATEDHRSHLGMHYTSVPNIMKVIKPLFLDDLREAFENAKGNEKKLNELYERIGHIKFMDPACGSGNFLIITYKELRQLEIDIIKELNNMGTPTMYVPSVTLDQFYGIEIEDFACDVTRLSLWIAEHQMNVKLHQEIKDAVRPTLPLHKAGAIVCGNALRLDWEEILPHKEDDEVYLFGNPPYLGSKKQTVQQKEDLQISCDYTKDYKMLDYVVGWFYLGAKYISGTEASYAFVTTDSICQGELVDKVWKLVFSNNVDILFAYDSFKWQNNARNNAGVIVTIIGLKDITNKKHKKLYNKVGVRTVSNITPYLTEGENILVRNMTKPISFPIEIHFGNMPNDGQNLMVNESEYQEFVEANATKFLKKVVGSTEYINGINRYCLWFPTKELTSEVKEAMQTPLIAERFNRTKQHRLKSSNKKLAEFPWKFRDTNVPQKYSIIVPSVSSENRYYVPMGIVDKDTIVSNLAYTIFDAPIWILGVLESRMHMVWLRSVGGKKGTGFRYTKGLVYNTFPVPDLSARRKNEVEDLALNILDIREEEGGTLAELYGSPLAEKNPKPMNPRLLKAHQELDAVVDRAYKQSGFKDDNERLSLLLDMYSKKVNEK